MADSATEIQAKIDKLSVNMTRLDNIVNGSSSQDIGIDTGSVPSISKFYAQIGTTAGGFVTMAQAAATSASGFSDKAALWAESPNEVEPGKRSAKYWAGVATGAVAGVSSFNGRSGNVNPTSGDYTTTLVTRGAGTLEASLVTIESNITANGTTASANAVGLDVANKNISILALDMADIKGIRNGMAGGIADPYDSEDGINIGTVYNGIDADTITCLHFDETNAKKVAIDSGFGPLTSKPRWDVYGNAAITTAQSKFGGSCLSMAGGALVNPYQYLKYGFGTGDFTIDAWVRRPAVNVSDYIYDSRPDSSPGSINSVFYITTTNVLSYYSTGATRITGTNLIVANTWYHVALVRSSGVTKIYLNGVQEGSAFTDGTSISAYANRPIIGAAYNLSGSNLFLDEYRISSSARWTANFTPPNAPYALASGTSTTNQVYDFTNDNYYPTSAGTTALSVKTSTESTASSSYALRTVLDSTALSTGGTSFRIRLTGGSGTSIINNTFLGRKASSGSAWHMDTVSTTPVRVTYNGGSNNITISPNTEIWSDWINFDIGTVGNDLVVAFDIPTNTTICSAIDVGQSYSNYFKASAAEASIAAPTGYTAASQAARYYITGMEVRTNSVTYSNMTLESVPVTALAVPTTSRLSIQVTGSATLVANTDIIGEVSRDGGTTWTAVTLVLTENYSGIRQYEGTASISSQPSGTSMKYRVRILNDKNALISGAVQQWS
jgi:hypothetical protein